MKLIKPSAQIIEPTGYTIDDIYKSIELAGRCSHKSEDKITETSAKDFVGRMLNMKHLATCEFGTVYLYYKVDEPSTMIKEIIDFYKNNQYSKVECVNSYSNTYSECGMGRLYDIKYSEYFITTNLRVCLENNRQEYLTDALCEPTEYHHKRYTVKFILDRGILAEFTRHRRFSFMAESTRYCNYSKGKFNNELTFIKPCWTNIPEGDYGDIFNPKEPDITLTPNEYAFIDILRETEKYYIGLTNNGWKAEEARDVLPLSLKTELYMCGFAEDWKQFFELRCASNVHPQAKELAIPLREEFIKRGYINE